MEVMDEQDLAYMGIGMEASELRARSRVVVSEENLACRQLEIAESDLDISGN